MNYFDVSNCQSPIPLARRKDLLVEEVDYQGETHWVVQSPQSNEYQYFNCQEIGILLKLDGKISYRELCDWFDLEFAPYRIEFKDLTEVISRFAQHSLLEPTRRHVGTLLLDQGKEKRRKELLQKFKNPLAIRWKGWDPEWFLEKTFPVARYFFCKTTACCVCVLLAIVLGLLLVNYEQFSSRMPGLWSMIGSDNWLSLGIAVALGKLLHELGHAYVHKSFGGQCHQIGVMIFYFMPTMYCDTSDSWRLPNKWHRIAIALGGVYVELFIFSLATLGWLFSQVGAWETFCLNLMFVCSVSAVITNGNPLLKYDGYYALADWLEIPNLAQRSSEAWKKTFLSFMGDHRQADPWSSDFNKRIFLLYGFGAYCFRILLIGGIIFYMVQQFQPFGLQWIAFMVASVSFTMVVLQPFMGLYKHFSKTPGNHQYMDRTKISMLVCVLAVIAIVLVAIPFPYSIPAEFAVELKDGKSVFVCEEGRIDAIHVGPGEWVEEGNRIVSLKNVDLEIELNQAQKKLNAIQAKVNSRRRRSGSIAASDKTLPSLEAELAMLQNEYSLKQERFDCLQPKAPISGFIYGVARGKSKQNQSDEPLSFADGNVLDGRQMGGWVSRGKEICKVGRSPDEADAFVVLISLEQRFNSMLAKGSPVKLILDSASVRMSGKVRKVANINSSANEIPESIAKASTNPAVQRANEIATAKSRKDIAYKDGQTLASTLIQAEVELDDNKHQLNLNSRGKAFIHLGGRTAFWRMRHWVNETTQFNF